MWVAESRRSVNGLVGKEYWRELGCGIGWSYTFTVNIKL